MSLKSFKKIQSEDKDLNKVQSNIEQLIEPFLNSEITDGVLIKNISLDSSITNQVNHKLGRKPLGWIVVRQRANSIIWDSQDTNTKANRTLELSCSANVTIDLWIF
jgi:hypothetical protein